MSSPHRPGWSRSDTALLVALVLATLAVRLITLRTIDLGGDATFKWFFVKSWRFANPWVFDHHTARLSITLPIWFVQQLCGEHPNGMYVLPLLAALAQVPLLYACGRLLGSPLIGTAACLLLLVFDPAADASSQLLPGIFQATFVLGALHCVLHFSLSQDQRRYWLALAALWLFAAYLAMVTTVYVFPGIALSVWLRRRNWGDVLSLFGILAALFGLETLGYAIFAPYPFGQFQMILHTHTDVQPTGFLGLFTRYTVLPHDWQVVAVAWLACALAWPLLRRSPPLQDRPFVASYALWLVPASAFVGMTFGVKNLDPIIPATDFSVRYCDVLMPLVALGLGSTLVAAGTWLLHGRSIPRGPQLMAAGVVVAIGLTLWIALTLYRPSGEHAFAVTDEQWRALNAAFERNLPIVGSNRSDHLQMKTLTCIQWAYLRDAQLLSEGELRLRKLGKTRVGGRTQRYLSRDPLDPEAVARAIKARRCVVSVMRRDAEPKLGLIVYDAPECPHAPPSAASAD